MKKTLKKIKTILLLAAVVFYLLLALLVREPMPAHAATTIIWDGSWTRAVGDFKALSVADADLINSATQAITSRLTTVSACFGQIHTVSASTPTANLVLCSVPDQTVAANRGKVVVSAHRATDTLVASTWGDATGTTEAFIFIFGNSPY